VVSELEAAITDLGLAGDRGRSGPDRHASDAVAGPERAPHSLASR
jgi:hypothetical protein